MLGNDNYNKGTFFLNFPIPTLPRRRPPTLRKRLGDLARPLRSRRSRRRHRRSAQSPGAFRQPLFPQPRQFRSKFRGRLRCFHLCVPAGQSLHRIDIERWKMPLGMKEGRRTN